MAYVRIDAVKTGEHFDHLVDYIRDGSKTKNEALTDGYKCEFDYAKTEFDFIRSKAVMNKGNNIAWHIKQAFAPEDNITPEEALKIGQETMKRMYPNHQYLIATHTDKEHIHNHILVNSVNFVDYHKLVSNKGSLAKLQNISDDLCRENALSVIERYGKIHKNRLRMNIDDALISAKDFNEFISIMQEKGYAVKLGKNYISFKDSEMKKYIRSSSISKDYNMPVLHYRIATNEGAKLTEKRIYDDKISYKSLRKVLRMEIDDSLKKVTSYDEFIADMRRKNFEVKQGKHLAFKGHLQERFLRSESIGFQYTEEAIKFRIENREKYGALSENRLKRVRNIDREKEWGIINWTVGNNSNIKNEVRNFIADIVGGYADLNSMYVAFMEIYEQKMQDENRLKETADDIEKRIKSLKTELRTEAKINGRYSQKADDMRKEIALLEENKKEVSTDRLKLYLEMQNYKIAKYNLEAKDGFDLNLETAKKECYKENLEQLREARNIRERQQYL